MSYDERLASRVRAALPEKMVERRMFGGLCFMSSGHICVSVMDEGLLVRVGREASRSLAGQPNVRPMMMGKRVMAGYVYVEPEALESDEDLKGWIRRGFRSAGALPPERS